ncbi:MAG: Mut7-C RNAse domain-containing protein [Chloroflexi bacterium]|nr:Mut7-C RNAse domain-containing protein [Chloroflexota bacterium]
MEPRFLVDINAGRLAKWLRVVGYDALLPRHLDDRALIRLALEEGRILLTKDRRIFQRRVVASGGLRALLIRSDDPWVQLQQVVEEVGLSFSHPFSRCIHCNEVLQSVIRAQVWERVPPYVFRTQEAFTQCPRCQRIYWPGSHWRNMQAELQRVQRGAS